MSTFQRATKSQSKLRLGIMGPSNSGKTWTSLLLATNLGARVAVIDSENGSASLYASDFAFDTLNLADHHPDRYVEAITAAEDAGYDVVVIDSITHAWQATKDLVDATALRTKAQNTFQVWGTVGKVYNALMAKIIASKIHVIVTMRSKTEYILEQNDRGKMVPKKVGLAPEVRQNSEYEYGVLLEMDHEHNCWVVKTRCRELDGKTWLKPGAELAATLKAWLMDGAPPAVPVPPPVPPRALNAVWTDEQKAEAGALRSDIQRHAGGDEKFRKLWDSMKQDAPSGVIDALAELLRQLNDVAAQSEVAPA